MLKKTKLVIFDLDGTLVDAYKAITDSVNFTLRKIGRKEASSAAIRKAVGWGDKNLLRVFVDAGPAQEAVRIYRKHHKSSLRRRCRLLPFSLSLLRYLSDSGIKIAIASNRPTLFTGIILKHLKIKKYFDYVLCADKLPQGKPHPEILLRIIKKLSISPGEVVYVGDMVVDIQAARNAGIKAVAVLGGSSSLAEIKKVRPFKIIRNLASLKKYL